MAGDALEQIIARFRSLDGFAAEAASAAAPLVQEAARATAAAGTDPEGKAWPLKKTGGRALEHAADKITAVAVGDRVDIKLTGPEVYHQNGVGKTIPARRIIPDGSAPVSDQIIDACRRGAQAAFDRRRGGG